MLQEALHSVLHTSDVLKTPSLTKYVRLGAAGPAEQTYDPVENSERGECGFAGPIKFTHTGESDMASV